MTIFGLGGGFNKHKRKKEKKTASPRPQTADAAYPQAPPQMQYPVYPNPTQQLQRYPVQNFPPRPYHQNASQQRDLQRSWNQSPYQHPNVGSLARLPGQLPSPNIPLWTKHAGSQSLSNLATAVTCPCPMQILEDGIEDWQHKTTDYLNQGAALCDQISSKLNEIITSIDGEAFSGDEKDLVVYQQPHSMALRGGGGHLAIPGPSKGVNTAVTHAITNTNYFSKANLYANSRLSPNLPPLRCYMPTYPLLCLAAQYSAQVYSKPSAASESSTHISADWRLGTKAMVIKSVPIDASSTIVFAIRGSQTFMDWAVNLNSTPASPRDFLDDAGNFCHSGFLSVAQKMVKPVAARLRALLEENPLRSGCSLVIAGHSAGGAVAALLYSHMLSNLSSELTTLTSCFKRVHCITFGAPPVSLLPLQKPTSRRHRKSLFLAFVNEGDPVPRADKEYVKSLLDLYSSPAPLPMPSYPIRPAGKHNFSTTALVPFANPKQPRPTPHHAASAPPLPTPTLIWTVPPSTLSIAGRVVLLRGNNQSSKGEETKVRAHLTNDEELRGVVFGDPVMHMMRVYERRIERLAINAVKGKAY